MEKMEFSSLFMNLIFISYFSCSSTQNLNSSKDEKWFYWPSEYNDLNEKKIALEKELIKQKEYYDEENNNYKNLLNERYQKLQVNYKNLLNERDKKLQTINKENNNYKNLLNERDKKLQTINEENKNLLNERDKKLQTINEENKNLLNEQDQKLQTINEENNNYKNLLNERDKKLQAINEENDSLKKKNENEKIEVSMRIAELEKNLEKEIESKQILLKSSEHRININIDHRIFFGSGSADLKKESLPILKKISHILTKYSKNKIIVEGNTDNIPIKNGKRYKSNWQLANERAYSVLNQLLKNPHLDPSNFSIRSYGEFFPLVPNNSATNRAINRRVNIVINQ